MSDNPSTPRNRAGLFRKLLFSVVPLSALLLVGAVGAELYFRSLDVDMHAHDPGLRGDQPECYETSITRGYKPRADACGRDRWRTRSRVDDLAKDDHTLRILVAGDSIADQDIWVQTLGTQLQERLPDRDVQVMNGGVSGYGTCTELAFLEEDGLAVKPDHVVLQYCLNDLMVASSVMMPLPDGRWRLIVGFDQYDLPGWVRHSRLATWVAVQRGMQQSVRRRTYDGDIAQVWTCLERMKQVTEAAGAGLSIVAFPPFITDTPSARDAAWFPVDYAKAEADSALLFENLGVDTYDLRPLLESRGRLEEQRNRSDDPWHPDTDAQVAIGTWLAEQLADDLR